MNAGPASARPLGPWTATALVVGNMIGSGVFLLPAALAPFGGASLLGWAVTLAGALLLAFTFARMAMRWPCSGGPYAYARNAFGDGVGFAVAWSYWISIWCANAAIAIAFAGSLGALWPAATATPLRAAACALAALWLCAAVNLAGVREAGRLQVAATALKLAPLLLFGAVGVWWLDLRQAFEPFNPSGQPLWQAAHASAALCLWALLGLEAATVPAGAVADPRRNVPLATVLGTLVAGVATVLACTVVVGLLPAQQLAASPAPMADAAAFYWGAPAGLAMAAAAAVSCLGALNGWTLLAGQLPLAAARDGVFPAAFARVDARGTPWFGVLAGSGLASALVLANYSRSLVQVFVFAILLSTAATLVPYLAGSAAWLRRGEGRGSRIAAAGGFAFSVYALAGIGLDALFWGAILLLAGVPVRLWLRRASQAGAR
ncbi:amino acid permease [Lysobacter enzymogenes]|uniref:amino acid permease n=1 Tax=Lysobacter enzymogenes TaxID=69 RepID=UPI001F6061B2|nr:amino acid permease [Lysobacter enzymogenes]